MVSYDEFLRVAKEKKIPVVYVRREYCELLILDELLNSNISPALVLKGGLALRLKYGSPRFSDDIDLGMSDSVSFEDFSRIIGSISRKYDLKITDLWEKQYTYLAEFLSMGKTPRENFRIKVELSKRDDVKKLKKEVTVFGSDLIKDISPIGNVLSIESLYESKLLCATTRKKPRDLFDLWYVSKKLNKVYTPVRISPEEEANIRRELQMYLPKRLYKVIPELYVVDKKASDETKGYYKKAPGAYRR